MVMMLLSFCSTTTAVHNTTLRITSTTSSINGNNSSLAPTTTASKKVDQYIQNRLYWKYGNISDNLLEILILFGAMYVIYVCVSMLRMLMMVVIILLGIVKKILQGCWILFSSCFNGSTLMFGRQYHRISIVIFFLLMEQGLGCNEIASIQATEKICKMNNNESTCFLSTVSILNIRPNGSIGCFRVQNKDQLDAFVEVQANAIISTCIQKTHHFARDFDIELEYVHRCWRAGSCYDEVCETIAPTDVTLAELTTYSRNSPGYTRCQKTCGCVTCGGCFYCSPSCILSRIYAVPKSKDIYEVINCPSWSTLIDVTVNFNGKHTQFRVPHGIPHKIPNTNISFTITGFSTPPTPLHGATFVKKFNADGSTRFGFAYTAVARPGAPSKGLIGEFQCPTKNDAQNFRCIFDENLCNCFPQGTSMTCSCRFLKLKEIVEVDSIPTKEAGIELKIEKENIVTSLTTQSLVSIHLSFQNQSIKRIIKEDKCELYGIKLEGCFSCSKGAVLSYKRQSSENEKIQATMMCPSLGIEFVQCGKAGVKGYINTHSSKRKVEKTCQLDCGTTTKFAIKAILEEEILFNSKDIEEKFADFQEKLTGGTLFGTIKDLIVDGWNSFVMAVGKTAGLQIVSILNNILFLDLSLFS